MTERKTCVKCGKIIKTMTPRIDAPIECRECYGGVFYEMVGTTSIEEELEGHFNFDSLVSADALTIGDFI